MMKQLDVFLIQDKSKGAGVFERNRASIEISSFLKVSNNYDWRSALNTAQGYSDLLEAEALMIAGKWIDDADCRAVISIFHDMNKPIFQQDFRMRRKLDCYIKSIELQRLLAEFICYSPLTKVIDTHIVVKPLTISHIRSKSRDRELVNARAIFCKACRDVLSMTLQEIAWMLNRDYTSVIYLLQKYDDWYCANGEHEFQTISDNIISRLYDLQGGKA